MNPRMIKYKQLYYHVMYLFETLCMLSKYFNIFYENDRPYSKQLCEGTQHLLQMYLVSLHNPLEEQSLHFLLFFYSCEYYILQDMFPYLTSQSAGEILLRDSFRNSRRRTSSVTAFTRMLSQPFSRYCQQKLLISYFSL